MTDRTKTNQKRPYTFETLEPTQLAWLAGLLQAEAHFSVDNRTRSKSNDPDYTPPPPVPRIKLDMIEKDLMEYVAQLVDQKVITLNRKTTAENIVYRITIEAREKTEVFLKAILPYIVGNKNRAKILELLSVCEAYNLWLAQGGKSSAARLAARKKKERQRGSV